MAAGKRFSLPAFLVNHGSDDRTGDSSTEDMEVGSRRRFNRSRKSALGFTSSSISSTDAARSSLVRRMISGRRWSVPIPLSCERPGIPSTTSFLRRGSRDSIDDTIVAETSTIGKKITLKGRTTADKKPMAVHLGHNEESVCLLVIRQTDTLDRVRAKIEKEAKGKVPLAFRFHYNDGISVEFYNEYNTRLQSCVDKHGHLRVCTLKETDRLPLSYSFDAPVDRVSKISDSAEAVVRCCLRLLETFDCDDGPSLATLPSPMPCCMLFFRDLGRATLDATPSTSKSSVSWDVVEQNLCKMERHLKTFLSREKLVTLMRYRSDLQEISECVSKIQKEILHAKINDDHPVFFVKIENPSAEIDSVLTVLGRNNFLDLGGEKHARTRHRLADLLEMSETDVVESIKNKGKTTVFERGMFCNAAKPLVRETPSTLLADGNEIKNLLAGNEIKNLLAPHIADQDTLIAEQAEAFHPITYQWAMKEFDTWVNDSKSPHRCFLLAGPAACGKTAFVSHVLQERSNAVVASHYCRHDDITTTDAKVMLLSIAYQLCCRFVSFENKIRYLLGNKPMTRKQMLSPDYPIASLFCDFLEGPLLSIEVSDNTNHCIIIDGIDLGNEGTGDKNSIVKAIRNFFSYLPQWMRIVVTTRPHVIILKRMRCFNAKMIEPKEADALEDFRNLFYNTLTNVQYGEEEDRRAIAETIANNARGNYIYARILTEKARITQESIDEHGLAEYLNINFDQLLEKELTMATETDDTLFWQIVRMSSVAFRALTKSDIVALTGCTMSELDHLLASAETFLVADGFVVRCVHNVVKRWLLARVQLPNEPKRSKMDNVLRSPLKAKMDNIIKSCHELVSRQILVVLQSSRRGNHFSFASDSIMRYVLQYGVRHFMSAGAVREARCVVLDPCWIMERSTDCDGILEDLDTFWEDDEIIQLVKRAILLSSTAITKDPRQIVGQLVGRMKAALGGHRNRTVNEEVQMFVTKLENHDFGFEWWCPVAPTWDKAEQTLVRRMTGHDGQVQSVDLHPSNMLCATACWDQKIRIWNTITGKCEAMFSGHTDVIWSIHWNSAGDRLLSSSSDRTVRVTKYPSGETELILKGHSDSVFTAKYSPDSSLIATGSKDGRIRVWCGVTGKCIKVLGENHGFVYSIAWKPGTENRYICSGGTDNAVRIWDLKSSLCSMVCQGHRDWVRSVFWSCNGRDIFSGSADQQLICWDSSSGECEQVLMGHKGGIWAVSQSQDGRYVFSSSVDGTVKIWECATWRCDQTLAGHKGPVLSMSVSSDGSKVLTGGSDNSLIEWDCEVERTVSDLDDHTTPVWGVDISPDEQKVLSASTDHTARLWNISTGIAERVFAGHTGPIWKARFCHSGRKIATASSDTTAAIYRLSTGGRILELPHNDAVWDIAWSKDDKTLYTAARDHIIRRWCTKTGLCQALLKGHTKDVKSISISADDKRLASASTDKSIRIWNVSTNECERMLCGEDAGALSVDWCPDNIHFTVGYTSGIVRLWDADTGVRVVGFLPGHNKRINSVSCSPDGSRIASASLDKEIRIWNVENESCERRIAASIGLGVLCVKYISGNRVISGGADRTIRIWNAENGRCETVMAGVTGLGIYDVVFSPDGSFVASGSRDRSVQIWDTETGKCLKTFKGHTNWVHNVDWEEGGKRVLSRSDDGTSRIWDVETGVCEQIIEEVAIPKGFVVGSAPSITADLSRRAEDGNPVGVQVDKVKICGERACGWIGKTVFFFKLRKIDHELPNLQTHENPITLSLPQPPVDSVEMSEELGSECSSSLSPLSCAHSSASLSSQDASRSSTTTASGIYSIPLLTNSEGGSVMDLESASQNSVIDVEWAIQESVVDLVSTSQHGSTGQTSSSALPRMPANQRGPSIRHFTTSTETRRSTVATKQVRKNKKVADAIRKASFEASFEASFKVGTILLASVRSKENTLNIFSSAEKCAQKVNEMFEIELVSGRELAEGVDIGLTGLSPPRRDRAGELPGNDYKNLCSLVFTASSIEQANCDGDRLERPQLISVVGGIVNDKRVMDGLERMSDVALYRRIERDISCKQDLAPADRREAIRVKWLTYQSQNRSYKRWEETCVELGFARLATDDAERKTEGNIVFYEHALNRIIHFDEMNLNMDVSDTNKGGRPASAPSNKALPEGGKPAHKSKLRLTATFGITGGNEALPPHFTFPSSAKNPMLKVKMLAGFPQVKAKYGYPVPSYHDVSFSVNEKGGMTAEAFQDYYRDCIIPLYPDASDAPGKRVMDKATSGHGRFDEDFLATARTEGFYHFPGLPNGNKVGQDCDQLYAKLKTLIYENRDKLYNARYKIGKENASLSLNDVGFCVFGGDVMQEDGEVIVLCKAYDIAMSPENIEKARRKCGYFPATRNGLNSNRVRQEIVMNEGDEVDEGADPHGGLLNIIESHNHEACDALVNAGYLSAETLRRFIQTTKVE